MSSLNTSSGCGCGCECENRVPQYACVNQPCSTAQNISDIRNRQSPPSGADCTPIYPEIPIEDQKREYRQCVDPNGCIGYFPAECRDGFWPSFAHPRWLCCRDLYNAV